MRTLIGGAALVAMLSSFGYTGAKPGGEPNAQTTETPLLVQFDTRTRYGAFVHITNVGVVDIEIESIRINDRTECSYPRAPNNVNEAVLRIPPRAVRCRRRAGIEPGEALPPPQDD
jgi:hypothetical protein